jgi:hypothetical protein
MAQARKRATVSPARALSMTRKERGVLVAFPAVETAADAVKAAGQVFALVGAGELLPSEGQALATMIHTQRRTIETENLAKWIAALEAL